MCNTTASLIELLKTSNLSITSPFRAIIGSSKWASRKHRSHPDHLGSSVAWFFHSGSVDHCKLLKTFAIIQAKPGGQFCEGSPAAGFCPPDKIKQKRRAYNATTTHAQILRLARAPFEEENCMHRIRYRESKNLNHCISWSKFFCNAFFKHKMQFMDLHHLWSFQGIKIVFWPQILLLYKDATQIALSCPGYGLIHFQQHIWWTVEQTGAQDRMSLC